MRNIFLSAIIIIQFIACKNAAKKLSIDAEKAETIIPINSIPFEYNEFIRVKGSLDKVRSSFIIDSGADWFCLDSTFHYSNDRIKYRYKNFVVKGVGNNTQDVPIITDSLFLSLGRNINYYAKSVPVINLKVIGGDIVDGLVGTDFLEKRILEINYKKEYIRFLHNLDAVDISKYKKIKMIIIDYRYCISLTVNINDTIKFSGDFMIDTGSPSSDITSSVADKFNLINNISHKIRYYSKYGGVGGESSGYDFIAKSLRISDYSFEKVIMSFSSDKSGSLSDEVYLGIIGNNILERFDVIFDFRNNNLYLKPNGDINAQFVHSKLGFYYAERCKTMGGWIVKGFYENSEAEKQGLKTDDKIISVNGIPVEEISYKYQRDTLPGLNHIKLVIERADEIKNIEVKLSPLL